jgi:microcompartment protein CcmK/EutM
MRLGFVIGRLTLTLADPALTGGRFLLVQPLSRAQFGGADDAARERIDAGGLR